MVSLIKNKINRNRALEKPIQDGEILRLHRLLKQEIKIRFKSKLKIYILDTGSCNACELELQALFTPLYDIQKLGVEVVYDVREAELLIITGVLTENMYPLCIETYHALKEPKYLITVGDCPLAQAPFRDTFAIKGQLGSHFFINFKITGCPPNPRDILRGLLKFLQKI